MRRVLVSFFGLGYGPVAPGTWGSFGALVLYLLLWYALGGVPWWTLLILIVAACAVSLLCGSWAVAYYGSADPRPVVIDEVAGMWLSVLLVPVPAARDRWLTALLVCGSAFVLFRILDVLKLPPAKELERLPAGAGILCDDLAAAVQTNVVLQIVFRVFWSV